MPHKRAKRSIRENQRKEQGADLAPSKQSLSNEPIPKSLARVLNAAHVREEWKIKKRKLEEDGESKADSKRRKLADGKMGSAKGRGKEKEVTSKLTIKPGESMQHFNRRVEDDMRPLVKAAVQTSNAAVRSARKVEIETRAAKRLKGKNAQLPEDEVEDGKRARKAPPILEPTPDKHANSAKEFVKLSTSAPRRLNDIAQAPPELKKLPRGAVQGANSIGGGKREGVLSMAQKAMMEQEREKAIKRYRELKANKRANGERGDDRNRDVGDED
ncbi:hypothetical protein Hypma_004829 [Hypsizygus marmoreus]|uniref:Uncharacterized protein n=1 Tax=Hypsizygus marmoreus TaxID=39966 RepID=A0A369J8S2_HYPMA|nr:hypothetical protein Hypma_004829 [Hypsizygus marmoreus]